MNSNENYDSEAAYKKQLDYGYDRAYDAVERVLHRIDRRFQAAALLLESKTLASDSKEGALLGEVMTEQIEKIKEDIQAVFKRIDEIREGSYSYLRSMRYDLTQCLDIIARVRNEGKSKIITKDEFLRPHQMKEL